MELAERLVGHFGGDAKVFLSNSGAEANEAAIKVARRWGRANRGEGATGIVATLGGFHGRTLATLAATGKPEMHTPFQPLPPGFSHVPFGNVDAMGAAIGPDTAAVLVEPIQGEAGIRVPLSGYLRAVRELTSQAGVLLIVDEIQSGMAAPAASSPTSTRRSAPTWSPWPRRSGPATRSAPPSPGPRSPTPCSAATTAPPSAATRSPAPPPWPPWT